MRRADDVSTFLCRLYSNSGNLNVRSLSLPVTPLQGVKFSVNRLSDVYEYNINLFRIIYRFQPIWNILDAGDDNKASLLWCDFRQNWGSESHVAFKNSYPYLPHVLSNWG